MLKNIKAVFFDLDGTLVDSMHVWKEVDIEFLGRFGLHLPPMLQQEIEGMSFKETAIHFKQRFSLELSIEEIMNIWNEMAFQKYSEEIDFKPGAFEFLKCLKANYSISLMMNLLKLENSIWVLSFMRLLIILKILKMKN